MTNSLRIPMAAPSNVSRRGRPGRHESEAFRTIAWARAVQRQAGASSLKQLVDCLSECGVDEKTLYRYLAGTSTPSEQRRRHIERLLPGTSAVFEIGPRMETLWAGCPRVPLPLWDAMWGDTARSGLLRLASRNIYGVGGCFSVEVAEWRVPLSDWFVGEVCESWDEFSMVDPSRAGVVGLAAAVFLDRWYERTGADRRWEGFRAIKACLSFSSTRPALLDCGLGATIDAWVDARERARLESNPQLQERLLANGAAFGIEDPVDQWLSDPEKFLVLCEFGFARAAPADERSRSVVRSAIKLYDLGSQMGVALRH